MKDRRLILYLATVVILALVPVSTMHILWPHFIWQNQPLNSTIEAVGALTAIITAIILLERQPDDGGRRLFWVATGLLGVGVLDGFHATSQSGQGALLLHSVAVLAGGLGFALVWLPEPARHTPVRRWIPRAVITASALMGIGTLLFRGTLPVMVKDGGFTTTARVLNLLSGVFFIAAAGRFLLDFRRSLKPELYLFFCVSVLFGLASLIFSYSTLWDDVWWFWHLVRLSAYSIAMGFSAKEYLRATQSLRTEISERKLAAERATYLASVLRALRNVNQLISREKDRERLIQKGCDLLVQGRAYDKTWILLMDEKRNFITAASSGLGEDTSALMKQLEMGDYPLCLRELLASQQLFLAYDQPGKRHQGCILADEHSSRGIYRCKLEYEGKFYGILGAAVAYEVASDKEEQALFQELCSDIAFALYSIEREEKIGVFKERYGTIIQTSPDGFFMVDTQGHFLEVNDAYCQLVGYSREELLDMSIQDVEAAETAEETARHIRQVIERGGDRFETKHRCRDGRTVDLEVSVNYLSATHSFYCFLRDTTERKQREMELYKLRRAVEASGEAVFLTDREGIITFVNPEFTRLYGLSAAEVVGKTTPRILKSGKMKPRDYEVFWQTILSKKTVKGELINKTRDGRVIEIEGSASPVLDDDGNIVAFLAIQRDISGRKRMEEQLLINDRLASIGELASGVAHELNNPLTSVLSFSQLLLKRDLPDDVREDLKTIGEGAERAARIVKNLLTFARKHPTEKQAQDINDAVERVIELRAYEQRVSNIQVVRHFAPDLPRVRADGFQLQQVFMNLIINAEYFMLEAHHKGTLTITTERVGNTIKLSFADDGPGIPKENLGHLFTPFFTTKPTGKGTGLGLSICHGIISNHDGRIYAESELGRGATFVIELPLS